MRAFFAEGVDKMHIPWAVEGLPMLLHLSLFLFFSGLVIFLFNVNHIVFGCIFSWIGLFLMVYGLITLLPIIRHDSPYHSPLSTPAWFLYASIHYLAFKTLASIKLRNSRGNWNYRNYQTRQRLRDRYQRWMLGGVEMAAEETAKERSSKIDVQILDWTISALGDDNSLKSFFEAIPGFFSSKLVKHLKRDFTRERVENLIGVLYAFLDRTWSSNSVDDSEKARRLDISLSAMNQIGVSHGRPTLRDTLFKLRDEVPPTVEIGHILAPWCEDSDRSVVRSAQVTIARILGTVRKRNDSWITLATRAFGLPEQDLRSNVTLGDDVLLAILIHVTRQTFCSDNSNHVVLKTLAKFDIGNTLPRLQHDFCSLWNAIVQEATKQGRHKTPVYILKSISHLYITLHQGTNAALTAFSASTPDGDHVMYEPSSYPLCDIASHLYSTPILPPTA